MRLALRLVLLATMITPVASAQYQKYPSTVTTTDQFFGSGRPWVDLQSQGARGDGQQVTDGVTNNTTTVTSASALFNTATDVGKAVICVGCNSGANLVTSISMVNSASSITLAASARLTLPVILTGGGCSANPYGYITVASTGVPNAAGVVTANGTGSCSSAPSCVIELQAGQAGSGATCTTTIGGGVVTAINVSGGTGYTAIVYWGTDDSTAFGNALTAACGAALFISKPQKSFYLINTSQTWQNCSATLLFGIGYGSWIAGDPGTNSLISISGGTASNLEVAGVRLSNVHTAASGNNNWPDITCNPCTQTHIHNSYFVGGRPAINLTANVNPVSAVEIDSNRFNGAVDFAIDSGSGLTTQNQNVMIHDNYIGQSYPTIFTTIGAPGHDINLEDTGESEIHDNYIWDGATSVPGVSCLQVYVNHASSGVSHTTVRGNICNETEPSTGNMIAAFLGANNSTYVVKDLRVEGNTFDGYFNGFNWSGISAANQLNGLLLKGNQIYNTQGTSSAHAIVLSSTTVVDERIVIEGNILVGPAAGTTGGEGMSLNRLSGISVVNNHISFMPQAAIDLGGIQNSLVCGNLVYDNGQQTANTYVGITIESFSNPSNSNTICDNVIYDDQGGAQTQKYGISLASGQAFNRLIGNTFPSGNKTADVSDGGTTGANNCTPFGSTVACDYESVTGNIAAQTLIPTTYLATFKQQFRVSGYLVCYASVAGSTVTLTVTYTDDYGTQTPTELSAVSCASAGQRYVFQDVIRLNNGSALSYSTSTVSSPVYRMSVKVEEQ